VTTLVLVHGAAEGGWVWKPTASILRTSGHVVYAPSLTGCGERRHEFHAGITYDTHAAEIAELLFFEDLHDAVLVGTSTGGPTICRVAELARERVARLIFVDALILLDKESIDQALNRPPPDPAARSMPGESKYFTAHDFEDAELRSWALARATQLPPLLRDPVQLKTFWKQSWDAKVIRCTRSVNPPESIQRRAADRLNGRYIEIDCAHYPMLTDPEVLAPHLVAD
jgi:pimeloyl-ACP methyl ester carboxylesterase